jgi:DNA topoisomerase I
MSKNLLIVESPAKAKTIEKYLGKDFTVKSSIGHIRDLPKSGMAIDIENGFTPDYQISDGKKKTVAELKKLSKNAEVVWLATDEDREGEAIAWHLYEALGLKNKETKRIVFHEITKSAIQNAVKNPREIDNHLVDAQQARRILDRLVGYELSPVLWKKVQRGLSAGRVQSVATRLIVEREREIEAFKPVESFKVTADLLNIENKKFKAILPKNLKNEQEAKDFFGDVAASDLFVDDVQKTPAKRKPQAPFTTSTLQQEASRRLGYSVKQTMMLAQRLYEAGHITYMRTDSVNLSDFALGEAATEIRASYGENYLKTRKYTTKSSSAQEAHEAIRPSDISKSEVNTGDTQQDRIYKLIWQRTIASQMADAELERTTAKIGITKSDKYLRASGEVIIFDGFLKVYINISEDDENSEDDGLLPELRKGDGVNSEKLLAKLSYTKAPARHNEASLVRKLEELGIGRPSTYAPTISTIQDRNYVVKESRDPMVRKITLVELIGENVTSRKVDENYGAEKNKLFPTDIGLVVNDFLVKHFSNVVDYGFTARVEAEFDEIANGKKVWNDVISDFYKPFHKTVEASEEIKRSEAVAARELGVDSKTGKKVYSKLGPFGPMVQLGETPQTDDDPKPKYASLPKDMRLETVTMDEAMKLFDLPRILGKTEDGKDVKTNMGRFGPYVQIEKTYVSISQDEIYSLTLEEGLQKIADKKEADAKKLIHDYSDDGIQVLNGRYGPYIKFGKKNVKIPKDQEPKDLTLEMCKELIKNAPEKKGRRAPAKKKAIAKKKS